jgi:hypothetical protein
MGVARGGGTCLNTSAIKEVYVPKRFAPAAAGALACLSAAVALPSGPAAAVAVPKAVTGPYQLYCPHSTLGDLVFQAGASGSLVPARPGRGKRFDVADLMVHVVFPQSFARFIVAFSPLSGTATTSLMLQGARPASERLVKAFEIVVPRQVPIGGVSFRVPAKPTTAGPFTASGGPVVVELSSTIDMVIALRLAPGSPVHNLQLACTAFPSGTRDFDPRDPWSGTGEPNRSRAISPVVAFSH